MSEVVVGEGYEIRQPLTPLTVQFMGVQNSEGYPLVLTVTLPVPGTVLKAADEILTNGGDGVITLRFPREVYDGHADLTVVLPD